MVLKTCIRFDAIYSSTVWKLGTCLSNLKFSIYFICYFGSLGWLGLMEILKWERLQPLFFHMKYCSSVPVEVSLSKRRVVYSYITIHTSILF